MSIHIDNTWVITGYRNFCSYVPFHYIKKTDSRVLNITFNFLNQEMDK